jgi:hypothetical protein
MTLVPLEDLEPSIRAEVVHGSFRSGKPTWAVVQDSRLDLDGTLARLTDRIEKLKLRMERMNLRYREEMRYGDYNDPGFPERNLMESVRYLEGIAAGLAALTA